MLRTKIIDVNGGFVISACALADKTCFANYPVIHLEALGFQVRPREDDDAGRALFDITFPEDMIREPCWVFRQWTDIFTFKWSIGTFLMIDRPSERIPIQTLTAINCAHLRDRFRWIEDGLTPTLRRALEHD